MGKIRENNCFGLWLRLNYFLSVFLLPLILLPFSFCNLNSNFIIVIIFLGSSFYHISCRSCICGIWPKLLLFTHQIVVWSKMEWGRGIHSPSVLLRLYHSSGYEWLVISSFCNQLLQLNYMYLYHQKVNIACNDGEAFNIYIEDTSDHVISNKNMYYCLPCVYLQETETIILFGLGTSEAFLHAVATENQLKRSNDSLLVFSVIYVVLNVLLIRTTGAIGLIVANSLSILFLRLCLFSSSFGNIWWTFLFFTLDVENKLIYISQATFYCILHLSCRRAIHENLLFVDNVHLTSEIFVWNNKDCYS